MEEFTSIAIWLLIVILTINTTIIWFGNQPTFTNEDLGLSIPGISNDLTFNSNDLNNVKNAYYEKDDTCDTVGITDADYGPCLIKKVGDIFSPITDSLATVGVWVSLVWKWAFAWSALLTAIFSGIPGGELFSILLISIFTVVELTAIVVVLMKIAGIIRGGS